MPFLFSYTSNAPSLNIRSFTLMLKSKESAISFMVTCQEPSCFPYSTPLMLALVRRGCVKGLESSIQGVSILASDNERCTKTGELGWRLQLLWGGLRCTHGGCAAPLSHAVLLLSKILETLSPLNLSCLSLFTTPGKKRKICRPVGC